MYTTAHVKCQGTRRSELIAVQAILQQENLNANYYVFIQFL